MTEFSFLDELSSEFVPRFLWPLAGEKDSEIIFALNHRVKRKFLGLAWNLIIYLD